jgi:hypothetical protein
MLEITLMTGQDDIVVVYKPMSFFLGAVVSGFTLLFFVGIYLEMRKGKKDPIQLI